MQQLWDKVIDKHTFLHDEAHQEYDWVEGQMHGLRNSMEKPFAEMVVRIEGFTQALKSAWFCNKTMFNRHLAWLPVQIRLHNGLQIGKNNSEMRSKSETSHCLRWGEWNGW